MLGAVCYLSPAPVPFRSYLHGFARMRCYLHWRLHINLSNSFRVFSSHFYPAPPTPSCQYPFPRPPLSLIAPCSRRAAPHRAILSIPYNDTFHLTAAHPSFLHLPSCLACAYRASPALYTAAVDHTPLSCNGGYWVYWCLGHGGARIFMRTRGSAFTHGMYH